MCATTVHLAGPALSAAMFSYSRDRRVERPSWHLAGYAGALQADAYAGVNELYDPARKPGAITEVARWPPAWLAAGASLRRITVCLRG
jgi:hypothetical protein